LGGVKPTRELEPKIRKSLKNIKAGWDSGKIVESLRKGMKERLVEFPGTRVVLNKVKKMRPLRQFSEKKGRGRGKCLRARGPPEQVVPWHRRNGGMGKIKSVMRAPPVIMRPEESTNQQRIYNLGKATTSGRSNVFRKGSFPVSWN